MTQFQLTQDPEISVAVKRTARARRLSLRVSSLDGKVTMTVPVRASQREVRAFANEKAEWIKRQLQNSPETILAEIGAFIPFEGQGVPIRPAKVRSARFDGAQILVPASDRKTGASTAAFLKLAARDRLIASCDIFAANLAVDFRRLTLRDTRSRWGSCAQNGNLMFSWRLVMAPPEVLQYVAAHEVAHLVEMNHSDRFWKLVAKIYPDYKNQRQWLRQHGSSLHAIRFG